MSLYWKLGGQEDTVPIHSLIAIRISKKTQQIRRKARCSLFYQTGDTDAHTDSVEDDGFK
ncbi:hypothetical protein PHLCEN_2v5978 [Hermanssonia centrifuga]|uniref:Uncharacterized protein n=1 Tax=Hermanssonia centrifuga TaxID=98765 RepID=A0A2R6P0T6_9APHY|nr:hypothetical protein PHLCEN_2v5978 [Hermanssonia centrifuga]